MSSVITPSHNSGTFVLSGTQATQSLENCLHSGQHSLKTVLHIINGEHFSGAERVQQLLGHGLAAERFAAHFACLKDGKFTAHAKLPDESVHQTPMRHRMDLGVIGSLRSLASSIKAELLHAHTPRSAMITSALAKRLDIPWVYHVHSPTVRDSARPLINQINGMIERRSLKRCDAVICVSQSLRDEMVRQGVQENKIFVAANGVRVQQAIDTASRAEQKNWRFGVVALFRPRKGLELLLDAFDQLCKNSSTPDNFTLEIIGGFESGSYEETIREQLSNLEFKNQINLHGFVANAPQRMRDLDVLVLPSVFGEGMPMVILEAMANGIPVLATKVEGTPEVIRDRCEGWLVEPNSVEDLTNGMAVAATCRTAWAQCALNAYRRQQQHFSDTVMCATVARIYRTLMKK